MLTYAKHTLEFYSVYRETHTLGCVVHYMHNYAETFGIGTSV